MGRFARGVLLGLITVLSVGVWPAEANVSGVSVKSPTAGQVLAGSYGSAGTPSGFVVTLRATASTNCDLGWDVRTFTVTGPSSYSETFNDTFTANWDTQDLRNGEYTVKFTAREKQGGLLQDPDCDATSGSASVKAKLANPPQTPAWSGSPTATSDGSAHVTIKWTKGPEDDLLEYNVLRSDRPGAAWVVPVGNPTGPCTLSGDTYTCVDTDFPDDYTGTYGYSIVAWRQRPDFNSNEDPQPKCTPANTPCVASAGSDVRQVTLTKPTPSPEPTPSRDPSPTRSPTGSSGGGSTPAKKQKTSVLSFGTGPSRSEFYTGTYESALPYQPKTLVIGGEQTTAPSDGEIEAMGPSEAPNFRTIMLPVAGGLLAFLSAAHVRRLLVHF